MGQAEGQEPDDDDDGRRRTAAVGEERREAIARGVARLEGLGATVVGPKEEMGTYWVVMQDPEGNEFCVH